jgi:vacuolar protein sorting-associated protein 26
VKDGKKFQHDGIRIELIGSIGKSPLVLAQLRLDSTYRYCKSLHWRTELFYDRGNHYEFVSLSQELAAAAEMRQAQTFDFTFKNVEKQYESYAGINVKLRYYLRVTLARRMGEVIKERELWVHSYRMPPDSNTSIKMEVGIEDCLHIEFEYNKAKWVDHFAKQAIADS